MDDVQIIYVVLKVFQGDASPVATYENFTDALRHVNRINNCDMHQVYGVSAEWRELKIRQKVTP